MEVMRVQKISARGLFVDSISNLLRTNVVRIVWQTVRRITTQILRVKEFSFFHPLKNIVPFWFIDISSVSVCYSKVLFGNFLMIDENNEQPQN